MDPQQDVVTVPSQVNETLTDLLVSSVDVDRSIHSRSEECPGRSAQSLASGDIQGMDSPSKDITSSPREVGDADGGVSPPPSVGNSQCTVCQYQTPWHGRSTPSRCHGIISKLMPSRPSQSFAGSSTMCWRPATANDPGGSSESGIWIC